MNNSKLSNDLTNINASIQSAEATNQSLSLQIQLLNDNNRLKFDIDKLANKISRIADIIDKQDLPQRITFSYVLLKWKSLAQMIADIIKVIR